MAESTVLCNYLKVKSIGAASYWTLTTVLYSCSVPGVLPATVALSWFYSWVWSCIVDCCNTDSKQVYEADIKMKFHVYLILTRRWNST